MPFMLNWHQPPEAGCAVEKARDIIRVLVKVRCEPNWHTVKLHNLNHLQS